MTLVTYNKITEDKMFELKHSRYLLYELKKLKLLITQKQPDISCIH